MGYFPPPLFAFLMATLLGSTSKVWWCGLGETAGFGGDALCVGRGIGKVLSKGVEKEEGEAWLVWGKEKGE